MNEIDLLKAICAIARTLVDLGVQHIDDKEAHEALMNLASDEDLEFILNRGKALLHEANIRAVGVGESANNG